MINDPRSPVSMDELRFQHELLVALCAKVTGVHKAVIRLRDAGAVGGVEAAARRPR